MRCQLQRASEVRWMGLAAADAVVALICCTHGADTQHRLSGASGCWGRMKGHCCCLLSGPLEQLLVCPTSGLHMKCRRPAAAKHVNFPDTMSPSAKAATCPAPCRPCCGLKPHYDHAGVMNGTEHACAVHSKCQRPACGLHPLATCSLHLNLPSPSSGHASAAHIVLQWPRC